MRVSKLYNDILMCVCCALVTVIFTKQCHAEYYYAGIANTAKVAYSTKMSSTMYQSPECERGACHAIAWSVLWDEGNTGQYVEAGMGYSPRFGCKGSKPVGLFWATPAFPYGERVACVPLGYKITTTITKINGSNTVNIVWLMPKVKVITTINVGDWYYGAGIHPTKVEVYSKTDVPIKPVYFVIEPGALSSEDVGVYLQSSPPYLAVGDIRTYEVRY